MSDNIIRGPDGKIVSNKIGSERAAELAHMRWEKPKAQTYSSLLGEAGYPDPELAPTHLRVLADYAVSGKSGAVHALRTFLAMTGKDTANSDVPLKLSAGERCPVCGHWNLGRDALDKLLDIVHSVQAERGEQKGGG